MYKGLSIVYTSIAKYVTIIKFQGPSGIGEDVFREITVVDEHECLCSTRVVHKFGKNGI